MGQNMAVDTTAQTTRTAEPAGTGTWPDPSAIDEFDPTV